MRMPHTRNQRRARAETVESTSPLMIALSMLLITSKRLRPTTIIIISK